MFGRRGDAYECKVYGEHAEIGYIIRSQILFAQSDPHHQRQIEVIPKPSDASYIYSNSKINQAAYKTEEGSQQLIDEILQLVTPSSIIIFDNQSTQTDETGVSVR